MNSFNLDIENGFKFYKEFILGQSQNKQKIYESYGFTMQGSVASIDWEVFAAILLKDRKKPGNGADLEKHEVKSAIDRSAFEYQYHKHHGLDKLTDDKLVDHIFISYSSNYKNVEVWRVKAESIKAIFESWEPLLRSNYNPSNDNIIRQRFRRSVTYKFVRQYGLCLFKIKDGVIERD
jgi:hypothetical protein